MALLKKTATGDWINFEGFVGAIMLQWQPPDEKDGKKHYRFLANPFDQHPHDIVSNGEDDAVLISKDMLSALVSRGVARRMTDEEAAIVNANAENDKVVSVHQENTTNQHMVNLKNEEERLKTPTTDDFNKVAPKVILPQPPEPVAAKSPETKVSNEGKKGK